MRPATPNNSLPTLAWLSRPLNVSPATATDRYADFTPLGCGGKAEVFRCRDQWLGREVAYKVLHHRLASHDSETRDFIREARILAGLLHPGIPSLHDLGRDCHGRPFFTQALHIGPTLRDVIDELRGGGVAAARRWPLERIAGILLSAGDAVTFANARGVVHCDLKPDNIIVAADDRGVVIDWGIACVPAELFAQRGLTAPGAPAPRPVRRGSPAYMAPEQVACLPLDERTDVFGLGGVLYECLTLCPPAVGRSVHEVLQKIAAESPPSPIERAPYRHITPELDQLASRALARLATERHESIAEFQAGLRECRLDLLLNDAGETPSPTGRVAAPSPSAVIDWWDFQLTD